ncbi:MAG: trigger factor [Nitrospiraceae bacterium]|nr:trigger factor [Nitrospiraceae bacterium]
MLKTVEEVSPTKKRLKIEIPPQRIEEEIKDSLEKLRQRTKVPGFRVGKAPITLIEKKFGKDVEGEVLQKLVPQFYSEGLKEAGLRPVSSPEFEETGSFRRNEPFNMTLLVEVMPKIEDLVYTGIKVKDAETSVEDKDVEDVLKRLAEEKSVFEPMEAPLAEGGIAILDYTVEGEEKSYEAQVFRVGGKSMPEEFSKGLMGKKKGESFDIAVKFPEDYQLKSVAGRDVVFHVTLKDTKKVKVPAIDDELAKDYGRENLEGLRAHIKEEALKSKKQALQRMQKTEIMKKLVDKYDFEAPASMVEKEIAMLVEDAVTAAQRAGEPAPDTAALKEGKKEEAVRNVKATLLLDLIGEREKIDVSEEDMKTRVEEMARRMSLPPEHIIKYYVSRHGSLDALRHAIYEEKVLDFLLEKAELER